MRTSTCGLLLILTFGIGLAIGRNFSKQGSSPRTTASPAGSIEAAPASAAAEPAPPAPAKPSTASTVPEVRPPAGYALSPAQYDFGTCLEGEARVKELQLERPAGSKLLLGRIYSPCPCITVTAPKMSFSEDEAATLRVAVHSLTLDGAKSFPVYAQILEPVKAILRAEVKITVNRVPAKLLVQPASFQLGTVRAETEAEVRILNLTHEPVVLKNPACTIAGATIAISGGSTIAPGQAVAVKLTLPANLPAGAIRGEVVVETGCPAHAMIRTAVEGTVVPAKKSAD